MTTFTRMVKKAEAITSIPSKQYDTDLDGVIDDGSVPKAYGAMYLNENSTATTLETAGIPVALRLFTTGVLDDFTFDAGSTGGITAYADYDGTVTGTTKVTDTAHGLATGEIISIRGTTNYNNVYAVTVIDANNFYIVEAYVADDGASDWDQGSALTAAAAGKYLLQYNISMVEATGGSLIEYVPYIGATAQPKGRGNVTGATTVLDVSGNDIITVAVGDQIFMTAQSAGTNTITNSVGQVSLIRV